MKAFEDYILSYPETNLNTFSERYFGYPEKIIVDMLSFVSSDFNWQSSKIGIVNDFGFQVVKYLFVHKCIDLSNITILITETKCIDSFLEEFSWTGLNFDYIDLDNKMSKEKFDLIIANPPFGDHGKLAKSVANTVHDMAINSVIVSIPTGFKDIYIYIDSCMSVPYGLFENMYIQTMCVRVNNKPVNRYTSLENLRLSMDSRKVDYEAAVVKYNTLHSSSFQYLGALKSKQTTAALKGKSLRKIFAIAQYSPAPNHRISIPCRAKGEDVKINILKEPINFEKKNCLYGIEFYTEEALENFKNFWYGFNLKKQGWKSIKDQEGSLINFIMDCIYTVGGDGPSLNRYKTFFPNVDWSRSWTDEEILEEIGLPKDFLKDIR